MTNAQHTPMPELLSIIRRYSGTQDARNEIERRVRAHDELVAALREIASWTDSATLRKVAEPDAFGGEAREANRIARAALAKVAP